MPAAQSIPLEQIFTAARFSEDIANADAPQWRCRSRFGERFGHRRTETAEDRMVLGCHDETGGACGRDNGPRIEWLDHRHVENRHRDAVLAERAGRRERRRYHQSRRHDADIRGPFRGETLRAVKVKAVVIAENLRDLTAFEAQI